MASVKYAISAYVADGTTTDYLITWDYLDEDHIAVYVDGTSNADPTASHTFSKLNDTTLRITDELGNAIVAGAEIEIRRETPLTTRAITFADGSALLASDLNKNSDYLLYSMQEVLDTVDAAAQDGALAAQVATEGFRDEAEGFRDETFTARNTTQGYLATVQSDATDADNHRIASAASEAAAATSESNSATSATNSANSATASANSATASAASAAASLASEQASAASETAAAASETAAAASETAAAASEAAAATSEANAAASFDDFDDRYLGAKASAPTVDNDGDALLTGALYWNTTSDTMYVWNGTAWDTFSSTAGISDAASSVKLTIEADGDVGIGVTPTTKLDVDGVIRLRDGSLTGGGGVELSSEASYGAAFQGARYKFRDAGNTSTLFEIQNDSEYYADGRKQFNFANIGGITSADNYDSIDPNSVFYAQGAVVNHPLSYNGMGMYLSTRGLGTAHDDTANDRALQLYAGDVPESGIYYRVKQGTSGWHRWKNLQNEWAALYGPTSYYGTFQANWGAAVGNGYSMTASTSNRGITINQSGYYQCQAWQRSTGTDFYIGIAENGNRTTLEMRSDGVWGHDHQNYQGAWSHSSFTGYLYAGEKITAGPASNTSGPSYGTRGYSGALVIVRLS